MKIKLFSYYESTRLANHEKKPRKRAQHHLVPVLIGMTGSNRSSHYEGAFKMAPNGARLHSLPRENFKRHPIS